MILQVLFFIFQKIKESESAVSAQTSELRALNDKHQTELRDLRRRLQQVCLRCVGFLLTTLGVIIVCFYFVRLFIFLYFIIYIIKYISLNMIIIINLMIALLWRLNKKHFKYFKKLNKKM